MQTEYSADIQLREKCIVFSFQMVTNDKKKMFERITQQMTFWKKIEYFTWSDEFIKYDFEVNYEEYMITIKFPRNVVNLKDVFLLQNSVIKKIFQQEMLMKNIDQDLIKQPVPPKLDIHFSPAFLIIKINYGKLAYNSEFQFILSRFLNNDVFDVEENALQFFLYKIFPISSENESYFKKSPMNLQVIHQNINSITELHRIIRNTYIPMQVLQNILTDKELENFKKIVPLMSQNILFIPNQAFGVVSMHLKNLTEKLSIHITTEFIDTGDEQFLKISLQESETYNQIFNNRVSRPEAKITSEFLAYYIQIAKNLSFDTRKQEDSVIIIAKQFKEIEKFFQSLIILGFMKLINYQERNYKYEKIQIKQQYLEQFITTFDPLCYDLKKQILIRIIQIQRLFQQSFLNRGEINQKEIFSHYLHQLLIFQILSIKIQVMLMSKYKVNQSHLRNIYYDPSLKDIKVFRMITSRFEERILKLPNFTDEQGINNLLRHLVELQTRIELNVANQWDIQLEMISKTQEMTVSLNSNELLFQYKNDLAISRNYLDLDERDLSILYECLNKI